MAPSLSSALGSIPWQRCLFFGFLFTLVYAAIVALSCLNNPTAEIHPFVYILGGMIALSPFVLPIAQQQILSHQRPAVRLRLNDRVADLLRSRRRYTFQDIAAFADCTWVDDDGSAHGELQVLVRDDDGCRWLLVAQYLGPADSALRGFAEELSSVVDAAHLTFDNRG